MRKILPTREEILWFFKYDRKKGILVWKNHYDKAAATKYIGEIAGRKRKHYVQFSMGNKILALHRVIWFLEYNKWPNFIDHIDGNPFNNKISNLRNVTNRINQQNRKQHRKGKLVGTTYHKINGTWMSRIVINKKLKYLGCYSSERKAHKVYLEELNTIGDKNV